MKTFSHTDYAAAFESYSSRQLLDASIKKFWVSNDFSVAEDSLLKPGEFSSVVVSLDKNLFPNMKILSWGMFKHFEISMRSCFAQSGIHIFGNFFDYLDWDKVDSLNRFGHTDVRVDVINRGLSNIPVKAGTPFFRLYFRPRGQAITGNNLYSLVREGKLKVEGEYGKTWCLVGAQVFDENNIDAYMEAKDLKENEVGEALTLKLFLNGNTYIPNNKSQILLLSKKDLVSILEPLDLTRPEHAKHDFNIGETYYVDFGDYFGAIIYQGYDGGGHHIISPLIDPGFAGPIRTEIVKGYGFNDFIELHIYHKDGVH